jgi:hypothetical protein
MDSFSTQTPRDKLEAWLRYYDDLNLGAFYTDRRTMRKRTTKRAVSDAAPATLPASGQAVPIMPPSIAPPALTLPIVNAPSLFEAIDRVKGDTLEHIREDLGNETKLCLVREIRAPNLCLSGKVPATMKTCKGSHLWGAPENS